MTASGRHGWLADPAGLVNQSAEDVVPFELVSLTGQSLRRNSASGPMVVRFAAKSRQAA